MRIEAYSQIQQVYGNKKVNKAAKPQKTTAASDNFQISSFGKTLQMAQQAVKYAPDVREDNVSSIKEAFNRGTYNVTGEQFADKLIEKLGGALS